MTTMAEREPVRLDEPSHPQRAYLKCEQCRRDGKKCISKDRESGSSLGKCLRCARLGHACGPRERAPMRRHYAAGIGSRATSDGTALQCEFGIQPGSDYMHACIRASLGSNSLSALHRLAKLVATQQVLFRYRCELAALRSRLPSNPVLVQQDTLPQSLVMKLNAEYQSVVDNLAAECNRLVSGTGFLLVYENLRNIFELFRLQHIRLTSADWRLKKETVFVRPQPCFSTVCSSFPDFLLLMCTGRIAAVVDPVSFELNKNPSNDTGLRRVNYTEAQAELQTILQEVIARPMGPQEGLSTDLDGEGYIRTGIGFPASHLAYWNLDKDAAFTIATDSGVLDLPVDIMNQTLIHLAVKMCDIGFLKRLIEFDKEVFTRVLVDACGHTPLDLAAILDDPDIFGLLIGRRVNLYPWSTHLLDLAVAANSPSIVDLILERGMVVLPPYTTVVAAAIERGLEDIAFRFLPWLIPPWTAPLELHMLVTQAEQKQLHQLTAELRAICPRPLIAGMAIGTLQQHLTFLTTEPAEDIVDSDDPSFSSFGFTDSFDNSQSSYISSSASRPGQL